MFTLMFWMKLKMVTIYPNHPVPHMRTAHPPKAKRRQPTPSFSFLFSLRRRWLLAWFVGWLGGKRRGGETPGKKREASQNEKVVRPPPPFLFRSLLRRGKKGNWREILRLFFVIRVWIIAVVIIVSLPHSLCESLINAFFSLLRDLCFSMPLSLSLSRTGGWQKGVFTFLLFLLLPRSLGVAKYAVKSDWTVWGGEKGKEERGPPCLCCRERKRAHSFFTAKKKHFQLPDFCFLFFEK